MNDLKLNVGQVIGEMKLQLRQNFDNWSILLSLLITIPFTLFGDTFRSILSKSKSENINQNLVNSRIVYFVNVTNIMEVNHQDI